MILGQETIDEFWRYYIANFGSLSKNDEMGIYNEFVAKCDIKVLKEAIQIIADDTSRMGRPRLDKIRREYWKIWNDRRHDENKGYPMHEPCGGTGLCRVAWQGLTPGDTTLLQYMQVPDEGNYIWDSVIPCICPLGLKINARHEDSKDFYMMHSDVEALRWLHENYYTWPHNCDLEEHLHPTSTEFKARVKAHLPEQYTASDVLEATLKEI